MSQPERRRESPMKTEQWSDASQFHETECAGSEQLYGEVGWRVPDRLSIAECTSERWRGSDRLALALPGGWL